ncbi:hypothetical protein QF030_001047 [Streptomyces rishiriensis]|uniref:Uncharacterized protein n=1 Tax=Streptomyces rishiriensis TaxID=68264 RepID=A0ABU0NIG3_STRRH|nr:hypothetical protein [Streptomyces rishiriensis]
MGSSRTTGQEWPVGGAGHALSERHAGAQCAPAVASALAADDDAEL